MASLDLCFVEAKATSVCNADSASVAALERDYQLNCHVVGGGS